MKVSRWRKGSINLLHWTRRVEVKKENKRREGYHYTTDRDNETVGVLPTVLED